MALVHVERLDHVGVMASVIQDVELIAMINARLGPEAPEGLTPGAALAGMIVKGLGCAHRPWSWPPPFCANTPLARWCREGRRAERWTRVTRGRTRDEADTDGCDLGLQEWALVVCAQAGIDLRCSHLNPTSVTLQGEDVPDSAAQALTRTSGDAQEHRPDFTPAVLELLVSQDGGVPCGRTRWAGQTSERKVFQARAQALLVAFQQAPSPRYRLADSTRSPEDQAPNLHTRGVSTRLPHPRRSGSPVLTPALAWNTWPRCDDEPRAQGRE
jgi:Domain of unknown function (DUF4277)